MRGSEDRGAARRRRRRLVESLNAKEAELSGLRGERSQLSAEEFEAEIEKERQRNLSRQGFPYTGIGGG